MAKFFIDRPVFAWVIAIFIMLAGGICITQLPISQYPTIASPAVEVGVVYPGASAKLLDESVSNIIEQELNGIPGLKYYQTVSESNGRATITATFVPGTDQDIAAVEVQNRIKRVESRLPQAVMQQGMQIEKSRSNFLCIISITSPNGTYDFSGLGDYAARNIVNEVKKIKGVGQAQVFAPEKAMRIWIDPAKLVGLNLSVPEVTGAIAAQNRQISAGSIGSRPTPDDTQTFALVIAAGQLSTVEEFENITLRTNATGASVLLRDVAKVELGASEYGFESRLNGKPAAAIAVQLSPTANALETAKLIEAKMQELKEYFPEGIDYQLPFDTSTFVSISIHSVVETLIIAMVLVFFVMFIFLQNIRYTFIPTIVVPVALLGTFGVMAALGFSINVLTMFGMVLAIGILVDDAIVVVENVERIMTEEKLPPREATQKAMRQITGAIIGMTLVLTSVFVPMAFFSGAVGIIYRQFSLTMVASIMFSALLALSLTPALCTSILKPRNEEIPKRKGIGAIFFLLPDALHNHVLAPFFRIFNAVFGKLTRGYVWTVGGTTKRAFRFMFIYAALIVALAYGYKHLPTSFLPMEDQGSFMTLVQLPAGASANRTREVVKQIEAHYASEPAVESYVGIMGFSFSGAGQESAMFFVSLKDWSLRGPEDSADAIVGRAMAKFSQIKDARLVIPTLMPPIPELGTSNGVTFRLQDRGAIGHEKLLAARNAFVGMIAQNQKSSKPVFGSFNLEGMEDSAQLHLDIDRAAAATMSVSFDQIGTALGTSFGSAYINDFPNKGRMQRVIVQARAEQRMTPEDLLKIYIKNSRGEMVPLSAFCKAEWKMGPTQLVRYNGYPAMRISATAAPGRSTGEAMAEIENIVKQLPPGLAIEWTAQSLDERQSGSQAPFLIGLSLIFVFLLMAALYESWSIPFAVMMAVPIGALGAVVAVTLRGMPNDVYFLVGLIAIIGLAAKNAILIIEFAKDQQLHGKDLFVATIEGARMRFRPILMTSFAFILGVLPLFFASGASSASQRAIGTGVVGGMLAATLLGVFFVPCFFIVVRKLTGSRLSHYDRFRREELRKAEGK